MGLNAHFLLFDQVTWSLPHPGGRAESSPKKGRKADL